jgi:hypothetical protein
LAAQEGPPLRHCTKPQVSSGTGISATHSLAILSQSSTAVESSDGPFDNATTWKHDKTFGVIGMPDHFNFEVRQSIREPLAERRSLIAAISKGLFQEWIHPRQRRQKQDAAIAILNVSRMDDRVEQQI